MVSKCYDANVVIFFLTWSFQDTFIPFFMIFLHYFVVNNGKIATFA